MTTVITPERARVIIEEANVGKVRVEIVDATADKFNRALEHTLRTGTNDPMWKQRRVFIYVQAALFPTEDELRAVGDYFRNAGWMSFEVKRESRDGVTHELSVTFP